MSDEADTYIPEACGVMDGEALIADPIEFFELTQSLAAIVRDGALFVLRRDSLKWENVEKLPKAGGSVTPIKPAPRRTD